MQQSDNFPYILIGGGIALATLLFSLFLMKAEWTGLMMEVPIIILILANGFLDECKEHDELLDKHGFWLWTFAAVLISVVEMIILFVRQFPLELVLTESIATGLAMMLVLAKDYLNTIEDNMQELDHTIAKTADYLTILPFCALLVIKNSIAPYVFLILVAAAVVIHLYFAKKYEMLLTGEQQ